MAYEHILVETRGPVGLITLNRPKAMNALCADLARERLLRLWMPMKPMRRSARLSSADLRKAFCAGADIKEMADKNYMDVYNEDFITVNWERLSHCRKPVVAAVAGYALGGGCEFAMMCDFILAAENAKFGQPEI